MKNAIVFLLLSLVTITSLGCPRDASVTSMHATAKRSTEIDEVFEALLRNKVSTESAKAYFISIDGKDPTPAFHSRFDGNTPPVKRLSEYVPGQGLKLGIQKWNWISDDKVELDLNSSQVVNAATFRYAMKRKDGAWIVESKQALFFACGKEPD